MIERTLTIQTPVTVSVAHLDVLRYTSSSGGVQMLMMQSNAAGSDMLSPQGSNYQFEDVIGAGYVPRQPGYLSSGKFSRSARTDVGCGSQNKSVDRTETAHGLTKTTP